MDKKVPNKTTLGFLREVAIVDIAINDLGFTLDDGVIFPWDSPFGPYSFDYEKTKRIQFETLVSMSHNFLCMFVDYGIDLAIQLAKKSGLLNYKITDTEYVTENFIEKILKSSFENFCNCEDLDYFDMGDYYQNLIRGYCLERMTEEQLEERIKTKIKTY